MNPNTLMAGASPFFYPGGEIGCLVVHGFTGAPQEVRWLGQHLLSQGYTVHGPRLAGHGTHMADMRGITWREWYADVLAAYHLLRADCQKVFVAGLSMGGALSLMLAANEDVAGVVAMSPPYQIVQTMQRPILKLMGLLGMSMGKSGPPEGGNPLEELVRAEQGARREPITGRASYPQYPAWALDQLWGLLDANQALIPHITAPALVIQSERDEVVPLAHAETIFAAISSKDKQKIILHNSGHVITEDVEREIVFRAVAEFIGARSA